MPGRLRTVLRRHFQAGSIFSARRDVIISCVRPAGRAWSVCDLHVVGWVHRLLRFSMALSGAYGAQQNGPVGSCICEVR